MTLKPLALGHIIVKKQLWREEGFTHHLGFIFFHSYLFFIAVLGVGTL
jgi:hypothetical protein